MNLDPIFFRYLVRLSTTLLTEIFFTISFFLTLVTFLMSLKSYNQSPREGYSWEGYQ